MDNCQSSVDLCSKLGAEVKMLRAERGLTQEALALSAGVDRTYVSQLERGIANPSLAILCRIADAIGVDLTVSFRK
jgi:transcriptional regulator with XRE-family HTH domain